MEQCQNHVVQQILGLEPERPRRPPTTQPRQLFVFTLAAAASTRHLRAETLRVVESGRWLWKRRHVELVPEAAFGVLAESCGPEEGPVLLPQTQIEGFGLETRPLRERAKP